MSFGFSPLCNNANALKDDASLTYSRYEPVYTETELLDIYQDILNTQVQVPDPTASVADEFEERTNDRTSVYSLIKRLDEHGPPEPGTSHSHASGVDLRGPMVRYRRAISQLAAMFGDKDNDTMTERPDPSSSQNAKERQILPSLLEWTALIRECVSTLDYMSLVHRFRFSRSALTMERLQQHH